MGKYYFTYEGDMYNKAMGKKPRKQYFRGGWTEVVIDGDLNAAINLYWAAHPEEVSPRNTPGTIGIMMRIVF